MAAFLVLDICVLTLALAWLVVHLRRVSDHDERRRTWMMIAAFVIGASLATTDFWDDLGVAMPPLASVGSLAGASLLAVASLRWRLLGRDVSYGVGATAVALALAGLLAYVAFFRWLTESTAVLVVLTATLTGIATVGGGHLVRRYLRRRQRMEELAILGTFAAQMARDLKNSLAALKGVQVPRKEGTSDPALVARGDLVTLVDVLGDQLERVIGVVDAYQRLGHMDPQRQPTCLNELARRTLGLQGYARPDVDVLLDLADPLPACDIDPDLVQRTLDNIVQNALDALPRGGAITVRTRLLGSAEHPEAVALSVEDDGVGMDARAAERAFDDFYTTKVQGSGLGLALARRVAEAHGAMIDLSSTLGVGTRVTLRFPVHGQAP